MFKPYWADIARLQDLLEKVLLNVVVISAMII